jgi:hypothetical protein
MTSVKDTPKPTVSVIPPIDINISWLLNNINDNKQTKFKVDRSAKVCLLS